MKITIVPKDNLDFRDQSKSLMPLTESNPSKEPGPHHIPKQITSKSSGVLSQSGVAVIYKRGVRRVTLQRLILSRIAHKKDEVKVDEILVLYDNFLNLIELSDRDPSFSQKFGSTLEVLAKDLKGLNLKTGNPKRILERLSKRFKEEVYNKFLLPKRNLAQTELSMQRAYRLRSTEKQVKQKDTPPKAFIGIGYRDKGSARDLAWDGSPKWQEVAMALNVKELDGKWN